MPAPQPTRVFLLTILVSVAVVGAIFATRILNQPVNQPKHLIAPQRGAESSPTSLPTLSGSSFQSNPAKLDPAVDGWASESFANAASSVLATIKRLAIAGGEDAARKGCFADEFLLLANTDDLPIIYQTPLLVVRRGDIKAASSPVPLQRWNGHQAVQAFFDSLLPGTNEHADTTLTLKAIAINLRSDLVETTIRAEASSQSARSAAEQTSIWKCLWTNPSSSHPQLVSAELTWIERVDRTGAAWFVDQTDDVLGHTDAFKRQLSFGLQHWLARIETAHGMNYFSKHGLAVGDVNGDGLDDLYVCQPGGLPNRLFSHRANGKLIEVSQTFGVDLLDRTASALFVDLDNDGDQDLALATLMGVQLFENQNEERFRHRGGMPLPDIDLQGLSAVDFDNDGDLDLYQIVDYASGASRARHGLPSFVYHNANDGGANRLFQNDIVKGTENWDFRDVTAEVGLDVNNQRHSLAAAWCDINNDGTQDLYVANDYGPNCLYLNHGGHFKEIAETAGVTDFGSGMSVSWGDYDRDGHPDLHVGNMFSSAGSRITTQQQFLSHVNETSRAIYPRFAKGNSLFRNSGGASFQEVVSANIEMGRWAWSSLFADINNDGWEDVLVANGYITTEDTGDL